MESPPSSEGPPLPADSCYKIEDKLLNTVKYVKRYPWLLGQYQDCDILDRFKVTFIPNTPKAVHVLYFSKTESE